MRCCRDLPWRTQLAASNQSAEHRLVPLEAIQSIENENDTRLPPPDRLEFPVDFGRVVPLFRLEEPKDHRTSTAGNQA